MEENKIILGDCIEVLKTLKSENTKIQLTVTSPPYFNAREYSKWETYEDYMSWIISIFSLIYDITEDGRMCCINVSPVIQPRINRNHESNTTHSSMIQY